MTERQKQTSSIIISGGSAIIAIIGSWVMINNKVTAVEVRAETQTEVIREIKEDIKEIKQDIKTVLYEKNNNSNSQRSN